MASGSTHFFTKPALGMRDVTHRPGVAADISCEMPGAASNQNVRSLPKTCRVAALLLSANAWGCQVTAEGVGSMATGGSEGVAGGAPLGADRAVLLPARIRRLTNAEYEATVASPQVIGTDATGIAADFVPDSRQSGFTVNEAQRIEAKIIKQNTI